MPNYAVAQHKEFADSASATTIPVTFDSNVTVGNLVCVGTTGSGVSVSTVTDSLGNTYAPATTEQDTSGVGKTRAYYGVITIGGACTVTVTYTGTVTFRGVHVAEFSSATGFLSSPLDVNDSDSDAGSAASAITTPDVTPAVNGCLLYIFGAKNTGNAGVNSPFTIVAFADWSMANGYYEQTVSAPIHGDMNMTGAAHWAVHLAAFKPNPAAPPPAVQQSGSMGRRYYRGRVRR